MNAPAIAAQETIPEIPGTPFQGGFYVDRFRVGDEHFALIVAPKESGEKENVMWSKDYTEVNQAISFCDGLSNTIAMQVAELDLAIWARGLEIDGYSDWYLPSRDELELCYRYLKPTGDKNWTWRNGENPSALPVATYPYTETLPQQTTADAFKAGSDEAFEAAWYWSSTQCSAGNAWFQVFGGGDQSYDDKDYELRARAVRRFLIIQ